MSQSVTVTIDERTLARMAEDARTDGVPLVTYLARLLNAVAHDRDAADGARIAARHRTADPPRLPPAASAARPRRIHTDALDAALDRAGVMREREG